MPTWFLVLAYTLLAIMMAKAIATVILARRYHRRRAWESSDPSSRPSSVTVVVPAYNEELTLSNCLDSLNRQTFAGLDVIVVDDGSTDATTEIATELAARMTVPVSVLRKDNGGKATALNYGLAHADGAIVVCVDADSVLAPDAIERIVEPFGDASVGAVGGIVKLANQDTLLGRQQAMEYISGLSLQRAAFAEIDSLQVLSGAISAFRTEDLLSLGGYSDDTIVEDFDVTLAVQQAGHRAVLHPEAVAYTEGPLSIADLIRQRHRWTYGGFQVLGKYRDTLFTERMGTLSRLGLPYFLLFPWVDVLVSVMFVATLAFALTSGSFGAFLMYFVAMSVVSLALNAYALHLAHEDKSLLMSSLIQPLFYAHVLTFTTARAGWHYLRRQQATWTKLERRGTNLVPNTSTESFDLAA